MRKSFYHILLLGALTLGTTSSCDDYLEVDHYDILPEDFMYRNEEFPLRLHPPKYCRKPPPPIKDKRFF